MNDTLVFFIGLIVTPLGLWAISLIKPGVIVNMLTKYLKKVVKDPENANKIENALGLKVVKLGLGLITNDPDKPQIEDDTLKLKEIVDELEKEINKK